MIKPSENENAEGRVQLQSTLHLLRAVEDRIRNLSDKLQNPLIMGNKNSRGDHERRKWQYGFDVHKMVRTLVKKREESKETSRLGHDFDYYPSLQGVANYMQQSDVPWKHAVLTIATLRSSNKWDSQEKNVEKLLRLMSAEFARIYFSAAAAAPPRTQCVARACVSAQKCDGLSGDGLGRFDIADRLTAIPNNNSVIIIVHGHSGLTADMHAPKESIWKVWPAQLCFIDGCATRTVYNSPHGLKSHLAVVYGLNKEDS